MFHKSSQFLFAMYNLFTIYTAYFLDIHWTFWLWYGLACASLLISTCGSMFMTHGELRTLYAEHGSLFSFASALDGATLVLTLGFAVSRDGFMFGSLILILGTLFHYGLFDVRLEKARQKA